jgi:hypothetical protein
LRAAIDLPQLKDMMVAVGFAVVGVEEMHCKWPKDKTRDTRISVPRGPPG